MRENYFCRDCTSAESISLPIATTLRFQNFRDDIVIAVSEEPNSRLVAGTELGLRERALPSCAQSLPTERSNSSVLPPSGLRNLARILHHGGVRGSIDCFSFLLCFRVCGVEICKNL